MPGVGEVAVVDPQDPIVGVGSAAAPRDLVTTGFRSLWILVRAHSSNPPQESQFDFFLNTNFFRLELRFDAT